MISLSRLIKSQFTSHESVEKKVISIRALETGGKEDVQPVFINTEPERARILAEAELEAESLVSSAAAEAEQIRQHISIEREEWEHQKILLAEEDRLNGYDQG